MKEEFELIAKTFQGLEEVLAKELTELGAGDIEIGRRMVSFTGDKEMMYKANFCLRTAIRILKPIKHFTANNADEVYNGIKNINWEDYLDNDKSFSVDSVVFSNEFRHSKFVAYKVKDAIVDYFREKTGNRPSVRINNPDIAINFHVAENKCTLSLDSSGESLHRRGYRQEAVEAPLNEVLAAGMIMMTGWNGECDLIDPMCGSGTIPIEAALIARNIAPGVFRKEYAFEKWNDFDQDLFDRVYNDDSTEREFEHKIYGFDNSPKANEIATHNIKAAGVSKDIVLRIQPFQQFEQPKEKSLIITNPPYGERISTNDLLGLYQMIGERLKHSFIGNEAWVLSYRAECFDQIGLKPSVKIPLFNGSLECEFRKYQIFDGKFKEFKTEQNDDPLNERAFDESFEVRRLDDSKDRPRRSFGEDEDKPRRSFRDSKDGERRSFSSREDRPRRSFGDSEDKPRRSFRDSKDGERRSFSSREDRPRRSFGDSEDKPIRSFRDSKDGERRSFSSREDRPRRSFGEGEEKPRRSFRDSKDGEKRSFSSREDRPRRNFGEGEDKPRRSFRDSKDGERRSCSSREDRPRRSFGEGEDKPRRSFRSSDDKPRRTQKRDI